MAEVLRVAALAGYIAAIEELGADPRPVLRENGLSPASLAKPEQIMSCHAACQLLKRGAEITGCRTFALHMAPHRGLADLGVTSLLIEHEQTLRSALTAYGNYRNLINPLLMVQIDDDGEIGLVRVQFTSNEAQGSQQAIDLSLSVLARLCFTLVGDDWQPEMVCFTCAAPPNSELPVYRRLFRCRSEFNAEFNAIVIASRDLDRPNPRSDARLAEHARSLIEATMGSARQSLPQQVEQSIMLLMPSGRATIQCCADLLGMTVRSLQRDLVAEGATFSQMLNDARMRMTDQQIANSRTRITDIAGMLGYGSLAAFTRWHQQAYGMSPTDRRKAGSPQ